jgi:hypothetical protein
MNKNKPKLVKSSTFSISDFKNKNKSLLDILDDVEETESIDFRDESHLDKKKCKCCQKIIINKIEQHQTKCFQNKIEDLNIKLKLLREDIKHEIHIKGLELLIDRNNEKWNKIMCVKSNE